VSGFNLANDPWIPCLEADGTIRERSLRSCLADAPELVGLAVPSPIASFALHRLLLAVAHAAIRGPASLSEAAELLAGAGFDGRIDDYLDDWQGRFELFDADRPFMQLAGMDGIERTVAVLVHEWASGNNTTLADHHLDAYPPSLTAAEAARALVTTQAFAVGGGVSKPFNFVAAAVTTRVACLLSGPRLLDTLVANLVRYEPGGESPMPSLPTDAPGWERDGKPTPHKGGTVPAGWLDYLTWEPRAIRLMPDDAGQVQTCVMRQHLSLPEPLPRDPHTPYRIDPKHGRVALRVRSGRALWRDAHAIVLGLLPDRDVNPEGVLAWGMELRDLGAGIDGLSACGLDIRQAKVAHWLSARLPSVPAIAEDVDRRDVLVRAIEYADRSAAEALRRAVAAAYKAYGAQTPSRIAPEDPFWAALETRFAQFLIGLGDLDKEPELALERWQTNVYASAESALRQALAATPPSGRGHQASAAALRAFRRSLPRPARRTSAEEAS
jgi:CRISPR system Cascade subunit CasA